MRNATRKKSGNEEAAADEMDERTVVLCSMKGFVWEAVSKIKEVVVLDVEGVG